MYFSDPSCFLMVGRRAFSPVSRWEFQDRFSSRFIPSRWMYFLGFIFFISPVLVIVVICG